MGISECYLAKQEDGKAQEYGLRAYRLRPDSAQASDILARAYQSRIQKKRRSSASA